MGYRIKISSPDGSFDTLKDILPKENIKLDILFIAKVPAPCSVDIGHYFQGKQGQMFWNILQNYGLLRVPFGKKEDDVLLEHRYGIMDIIKKPREYGSEPTRSEYISGMERILDTVNRFKPKVVVFVYKGVLDKILAFEFDVKKKALYGFNDNLSAFFGGSRVFVFPMPGTPCKSQTAKRSMNELKEYLSK